MDLFYVLPGQLDLERALAVIDGDEFHHLARVLRCRQGQVVEITDGDGLSAMMTIESIGKRTLEGSLSRCVRHERPTAGVTVAMSMLKSPQRFDLFLEKATELGVDRIVPMTTQRTVSTPSAEKSERKVERWKGVIQGAARQCRRYFLPELSEPMPFAEVLRLPGYDVRLLPYESGGARPLFDAAGRRILFVIGGEGGFTEREVSEAVAAGFETVTFGGTILRAETAGIFAVALVRSRLLEGPGLSASC